MDLSKLKGNLGLKSSALAPTACKLSSQFLVLDHMSNHYTKIAKAKSAIDSRPPKSLMTSQKMRDRMNCNRFVRSPQPRSHSTVSGTGLSDYEDILKDEPEDEEEKLVHSIMRSTLLEKSSSSNNATSGAELHLYPYQHEQMSTNIQDTSPYGAVIYDRPASVRSVRSGHSLTSSPSRMAIATNLLVKRTCKGDVLEKRPHLFTEPERPFTPRTLKKNTESRLKNSKCYNPPHNKSAKKENTCEKDAFKVYEKDTVKTLEKGRIQNKKQQSNLQSPSPQNKKQQSNLQSPSPQIKVKVNNQPEYDLEGTVGTSNLSDSALMEISLRSRDETYSQEMTNSVPPLAITMDKDHMNWLQEQASKAEIRVRSSGRLKSSLHPDEELHPASRYHGLRESGLEQDVKVEKLRKDEEQKYLAFAKEVTDDVLSRGISSDSVLDKVFENHIVRRKDDLDEGRMRKVISDLRKNLGLKDSFTRGHASVSLSNSNYNNKSRREYTTDNSRSRDGDQMYADSHMNLTSESMNTLKFGQTGDVLSTINSEASLDKKETEHRLDGDNEMAVSQTLKDYQHSLADKEEKDDSVRGSEHNVAEENILKHQYNEHKPDRGERSIAGEDKFRSEISSVEAQNRSSVKLSQQMANRDHFLNIGNDEVASGVVISQKSSGKYGNHNYTHEEMSSIEKKSLATSPEGSQVTDGHNDEDTSIASSVLSQRPVARPRTRARQGSHERTQAAGAGDDEVTHHEQQDIVQMTSAGGLDNNSPTPGGSESADSTAAGSRNKREHTSEVAKYETDHQQAVEDDDEYEDDYEEIIESEDDSQHDSADDF